MQNDKVTSLRVVIENWFGCEPLCEKRVTKMYTWNEEKYEAFTVICQFLTNIHTNLFPIRFDNSVAKLICKGIPQTRNTGQ